MFRYRLPFFSISSPRSSHFHSCFQAARYLFPRPFFFFLRLPCPICFSTEGIKLNGKSFFSLIMIPFFTVRRCRTRGRFNQPNTRRSIMLNGTREFFSFVSPLPLSLSLSRSSRGKSTWVLKRIKRLNIVSNENVIKHCWRAEWNISLSINYYKVDTFTWSIS